MSQLGKGYRCDVCGSELFCRRVFGAELEAEAFGGADIFGL